MYANTYIKSENNPDGQQPILIGLRKNSNSNAQFYF